MRHIHPHLSNPSQQGTQSLAPVKTTFPVCVQQTQAYATDNIQTINTFDGNLIRKKNRQLCRNRDPQCSKNENLITNNSSFAGGD